jgi:hypothetical protein
MIETRGHAKSKQMTGAEIENTSAESHRIPLAGAWEMWRTVCLRGAGFPVAWLERIASGDGCRTVRDFLDAEESVDQIVREIQRRCRLVISNFELPARREWSRAKRLVEKRRVPKPIDGEPEINALFESLSRALANCENRRQQALQQTARDRFSAAEFLRSLAVEPRFREAIIWQNRRAVGNTLEGLVRGNHQGNAAARSKEHFVYSYLQRYCAKNETIGFFGPVGWACVADEPVGLEVKPGTELIGRRCLHWEYWAIDKLARELCHQREVLPWLAPRLHPASHLNGERLELGDGAQMRLSPDLVRLLNACDGKTPALKIATALAGDPATGFQSAAQVLESLWGAAERKAILWNATLPVELFPDKRLRRMVESIGQPAVRQRLTGVLDEVDTAFQSVAAARGNPDSLDRALAGLEATFERVTKTAPIRSAGRTYAARTLVYEDCRRDAKVTLGSDLVAGLAEPLSLVLDAAAWYAEMIESRLGMVISQVFRQTSPGSDGVVPAIHLLAHSEHIQRETRRIVLGVERELQDRWSSMFAVEGRSEIQVTAKELRDPVARLFPRMTGGSGGGYHSPDVMILADAESSLNPESWQFVLGEVHAGINAMMIPCLLEMHPDPERLKEYERLENLVDRVSPAPECNTTAPRRIARTGSANGMHWEVGETPSRHEKGQVVPISEVVFTESNAGLVARTRDGRHQWKAVETMRSFYSHLMATHFSLFAPASLSPRIAIDRLIIARRGWTVSAGEISFAMIADEDERFLAAHRWKRQIGLPRWVFVRVPFEQKPYYVDFHSPVSLDALAKLTRRAREEGASIRISEMLPTPEQCWLTDASGNRYTSELRIATLRPRAGRDVRVENGTTRED